MTWSAIANGEIDQDSPGTTTLMAKYRGNNAHVDAVISLGHPFRSDATWTEQAHGQAYHCDPSRTVQKSALTLGDDWNPTGMAVLVNETARAMPNGDETLDLETPLALAVTNGFAYVPFVRVDSGATTDTVLVRALRATPAMLRLVVRAEETGGGVPTGTYSLKAWKVPLQGSSTPATSSFDSIADSEVQFKALLTDTLLTKLRDREQHTYNVLGAEHDQTTGVHRMGLAQVKTTRVLNRQAITADPVGAQFQTFACSWIGAVGSPCDAFVEAFADGVGDTGLDLYLGWVWAAGTWATCLVAERVAGGTIASGYEVSVWRWDT